MNDFGIDIKGKQGVVKACNYYKKPSKTAERTVTVLSGPGCDPNPARGRKIEVRYKFEGKDMFEDLSSYDLEYVLVDGKKLKQKNTGVEISDIADIAVPRGGEKK